MSTQIQISSGCGGGATPNVKTSTFDTTITNTLDITGQWASASASNNIYSESFVLTKIY